MPQLEDGDFDYFRMVEELGRRWLEVAALADFNAAQAVRYCEIIRQLRNRIEVLEAEMDKAEDPEWAF